MKYPALLTFLLSVLLCTAQDKEETFLISRNIGYTKVTESDSVKTMGFVESLQAAVKIPGPTLRYSEGDSVEITLWNVSQGAPHTIHLHGLDVDQQNDGVPMLSFEVGHMEKGYYRFKAPHSGTYLYHCHVVSPIHVQAGMYGLLIIDPKDQPSYTWKDGYRFEREFHFLTSEIDSHWHTVAFFQEHHSGSHFPLSIPDYQPQYFLVNGNSGWVQSLDSIEAQGGKNTLLRLANVGFEANYYVFPERLNALVISSDGRPLPMASKIDTLYLFPGERYQVLLQPEQDATFDEKIALHFYALHNKKDLYKRELLVRVDDFSALAESSKPAVEIYPNPVVDQLHIALSEPQDAQITIFNLSGEVVLQGAFTGGRSSFDLSGLAPSLYTLELRLHNQSKQYSTFYKVAP